MESSPTALRTRDSNLIRGALRRLAGSDAGDLAAVMARREALRFLYGARSRQALCLGLAGAAGLALLIPVHRTYSGTSGWPYFLLFSLAIQLSLFVLSLRAVWASMRLDAAAGSVEELILTGADPAQVLLGKWLGLSGAAFLWCGMLLPPTLLAAAFTRAAAADVALVMLSWLLSASAGGMLGTLFAFSSKIAANSIYPIFFFGLQFWIMARTVFPRVGARSGAWWSELLRWIHQVDPMTLVPAALGSVREPWLLKVGFVLTLLITGALWITAADRDLPLPERGRPRKNPGDLFSLRPVRAWVTSGDQNAAPAYDREVLFPFESAYGWRLRVSPPMWLCLLALGAIPAVSLAILGQEAGAATAILSILETSVAAALGALGMASSLAGEREQGRWAFLLTAPFEEGEIVRAKWKSATLESWPLWVLAAARAPLLALTGALPWSAVPVSVLAVPVAAAVSAAAAGALCATAHSLTVAQQRALLWLFLPPLAAVLCFLLLPAPGFSGYLGLPLVLLSALKTDPGFAGPLQALLALGGYTVIGMGALRLAVWQLRRWPPV